MKTEYILKHKDMPVMAFIMDDESYNLLDITEIIEEERLPFGLKDRGNKTQYAIQFNNWLIGRGLSESRKDLHKIKKQFNAKSAKELLISALGLNLTDHYWIHKADTCPSWNKVNYFDNKFDKLIPGKGFIPQIDKSVNKQSPNLCVDGSIEKRWIIKNGERVLLKGSIYNRMQEPFNEVLISKILDKYNIDHVHYKLGRTQDSNIPYCECKCMVSEDIEYINAYYVMNMQEYYRKEPYSHYLETCKNNGILNAKSKIDEMIAVDFIFGNIDRHKGNFGIFRDSEDLKWLQIAPLFDNGNTLFYDCENEDIENFGIDTLGKAFGDSNRLNLEHIEKPSWYSNAEKSCITDIAFDILSQNDKLLPKRIDKIISILKERLNILEKIFNL